MFASRQPASRRNRSPRRLLNAAARCAVETLEQRTLMCALPHRHDNPIELRPDLVGVSQQPGGGGGPEGGVANIVWENRGNDDFETFGASANLARAVVDQVILDWEAAIASFNYADGSTTFEVNIEVDGDNGNGGSGGTDSTLGGKPKSGSVNIAPGNNGAGGGWYFDPNPDDHSEFTGSIAHAYTATAPIGSPARGMADLYTLVNAEIAHALGLGSDLDGWNDRTTNTGTPDNAEGGGIGNFYTFTGASVRHLLTSNNGGSDGEDWGEAVHTAGVSSINIGGTTWNGTDDAGNASYEFSTRYLVPQTIALMFQDAYGYTIRPQRDNFYSDLNESTGVLTIRGGQGAAVSADTISIDRFIDRFFRVSVDLGADVAGTGSLPGAGNLPAFVSGVYDPNQITQIVIDAGAGNDTINVNYVNELNDLTINCGAGNDTVNFAQVTGHMDDVLGLDLVVNGDAGTDTLALFDTTNTRNDPFLVTSTLVSRAGFLNVIDHTMTENLRVNAGAGNNAISVTSLASSQNLIASAGNGDDTFNVGGNTNTVGNTLGAVSAFGQGGTGDTLNYNDSANAGAATSYSLSSNAINRTGAGLTSYGTVETINLNAGSGANAITVPSTAAGSGTTVNGGGGGDTITVGISNAALLTVNGGDADDTVNLNNVGSMSGIVVINGNAGALDRLNYNDQNNSAADDYELNAGAIERTGAVTVFHGTFESVVVSAGIGSSTFDVETGGAATSMTVNAGDGNDGLRVTFASGNLGNVDGPLTFNGGAGSNTASLYDNSNAAADAFTISSTQVTRAGFGGLTYASVGGLALTAGAGGNAITVNSTAAATPVTINAGGGNDAATVGGGDIDANVLGNVLFNGNAGTDSLTFNDTTDGLGADTYTLNVTTLRKITGGTTSWSLIESVTMNGSNNADLYEVLATATGVPLTVNGGNGSDQFQLGAIGNGNLNSLPGALTLQGQAGTDTVTLHDSGSTVSDNYTITETALTHPTFGGLTYAGMEGVNLNASSGANVIDARAGFLCPVTLNAGAGTDTINVNETALGAVVRINASSGNDAVRVNPDGAGQAYAHFMQTQRIGQLTIGAGGNAAVFAGADKVLTMSGLSITGTGALNVTDNDVIIDYTGASPLSAITALLNNGYNNGGWLGSGGIHSFSAFVAGNTGVGVAESTDLFGAFPATFSGQNVDNTAILLKYTAYGDANLDGTVNLADFNRLAANFGQSARRWSHGDTNFDGTVNLFDFNRLAANFGSTGFLPTPDGTNAGGKSESVEDSGEALDELV
jgi:hypothetical protein